MCIDELEPPRPPRKTQPLESAVKLTPQGMVHIWREVHAGRGNHGEFLRAFAYAILCADDENLATLLPASFILVFKYNLISYLTAEPKQVEKFLKITCACGAHRGYIPSPYVSFSILKFLMLHNCTARQVTLRCICGAQRKCASGDPGEPYRPAAEDGAWMLQYEKCEGRWEASPA